MKNLILIIISVISVSFLSSCEDSMGGGYDDTYPANQNNGPYVYGSVNVTVGNGGNGGAPVAPIQAGTGWVRLPVKITPPELLFCYYLQPTEYFPVAIYTSNTTFLVGCITRSMAYDIEWFQSQNHIPDGQWIKITHLQLSCETGTAQQVIGFAP